MYVTYLIGPENARPKIVSLRLKFEGAEPERVDARNALRAVGDIDRLRQIVEKNADDLAEAQGDDGEVIATQFECGRAQDQYDERSNTQATKARLSAKCPPKRQVQAEMR